MRYSYTKCESQNFEPLYYRKQKSDTHKHNKKLTDVGISLNIIKMLYNKIYKGEN